MLLRLPAAMIAWAILVFVLVIGTSLWSLRTNNQLEFFCAEEYVELGWNFYQYGRFYGDLPIAAVFRPPGYSFFVAGVFAVVDQHPGRKIHFKDITQNEQQWKFLLTALMRAQALLLASTSVMIFLLLKERLGPPSAALWAVLFGVNPYCIMLTGLLHYDMLHIFLSVVATAALVAAFQNDNRRAFWLLAAGGLWGLATLVRPLTLLLPAFVAGLALFESLSWRRIAKSTLLFGLGMALVIAPYTAKNLHQTGRFIPVNAQAGIALWASTHKRLEHHPNYYRWTSIWYPEGEAIFKRVVGSCLSDNAQYAKHVIMLEDEFKRLAIGHLLRSPMVYLHNVAGNLVSFVFDMNDVYIKIFQRFQRDPQAHYVGWITDFDNPQDFHSSREQHMFYGLVITLLAMSVAGVSRALLRHDREVVAAAAALACFLVAYSLSYVDLTYHAIKVPLLFLLAGHCIGDLKGVALSLGARKTRLSVLVLGILTVWTGWLVAAVL